MENIKREEGKIDMGEMFMFKKEKHSEMVDVEGVLWVVRAINKRDLRYSYLIYDKGYFVGTDRFRLHAFKTRMGYPEGQYKVEINTKTQVALKRVRKENIDVFKWESIIPTNGLKIELRQVAINDQTYNKFSRLMGLDSSYYFEYKFFMDIGEGDYDITLHQRSKESAPMAMFQKPDHLALLMSRKSTFE